MKTRFRLNAVLIPFLVLALAVGFAFHVQANATAERKRQICQAEIEDRIVVRDIIGYALGQATEPRAVAFRNLVYDRLQVPPKICTGTGVDIHDVFHD